MIKMFTRGQNVQLTEHFNSKEWECKCGICQGLVIDINHVNKLEQLRNELNEPINIMSGFRCPAHNAKVKGAKHSQHLRGTATDIIVSGYTPDQIADICEEWFKDGGLGRYNSFTHVDSRGKHARWDKRT